MHRHYYAAHSYLGLGFTYDSPCWMVYVFNSKKERDEWVQKNEYSQDTGNLVAEAVSCDEARRIAPDLRGDYYDIHSHNHSPSRAIHL